MKKAITFALCLIIGGCVIFGVGFAMMGYNFNELNMAGDIVSDSFESAEDVRDISISYSAASVRIERTDVVGVAVESVGYDEIYFDVSIEDGVLKIEEIDTRPWWKRLISIGLKPSVTVKLSGESYGSLVCDGSSGDTVISDGLIFESVDIDLSTGRVSLGATVSGNLKINSSTGGADVQSPSLGNTEIECTTGPVSLNSASVGNLTIRSTTGSITVKADVAGAIYLEAGTGSVAVENTECTELKANATTGSVIINTLRAGALSTETTTGRCAVDSTVVSGEAKFKSSTGSISFTDSDAASLRAETTTGGIYMTLLSIKSFDAQTTIGGLNIPEDGAGGECYLRTSTGGIHVEYVD